ncbi:MAG: hypothetical protein AB8H03_05775 [Saprospiraceae bacterium]
MKKIITPIFLLAFTMILVGKSCCPKYYFSSAPTCYSDEALFNTLTYEDENYQNKVFQILATSTPEQFRYFRKIFLFENGTDYLVTNFRNDEQCFDVKLRLEDLGKLAGMKRKNGVAYPVELYDLKWSLEKRNGKMEVLYLDMHRIID